MHKSKQLTQPPNSPKQKQRTLYVYAHIFSYFRYLHLIHIIMELNLRYAYIWKVCYSFTKAKCVASSSVCSVCSLTKPHIIHWLNVPSNCHVNGIQPYILYTYTSKLRPHHIRCDFANSLFAMIFLQTPFCEVKRGMRNFEELYVCV